MENNLNKELAEIKKGCGKEFTKYQKCGSNISNKYETKKGVKVIILCNNCQARLEGALIGAKAQEKDSRKIFEEMLNNKIKKYEHCRDTCEDQELLTLEELKQQLKEK